MSREATSATVRPPTSISPTSGSEIFPTPGEVVAGTAELARKGVLLRYIVASLFRVSTGYLLAVLIGVPLCLILGWFGLPRLGLVSAAWGSVASGLLTLSWLAFHLGRRKHVLTLGAALARAMRPDLTLLPTLLRLGIQAAIGMVVMSAAEVVLLGLVNTFGSEATAAYGAVNQVMSCVQFPALSIAMSDAPDPVTAGVLRRLK